MILRSNRDSTPPQVFDTSWTEPFSVSVIRLKPCKVISLLVVIFHSLFFISVSDVIEDLLDDY